ncbi:MAG: glycine zipper 2TM domain-containing protein [Mariprofundaceae bacterium]|nr:glycine zipper 2TM domain-containing protein [Mariprofundaceae bacterium]
MFRKFFVLCTCIIFYSVAAQAGDKAIMGTLLGAGLGAAIGHSADRTGGAGKGAAIGAIGGYFIGQQMDKNKARAAPPSQPRKAASYNCQSALNDTDYASNIRNKGEKVFLLQNALRICPSSARIHNDLGVAYYQRSQRYDEKRARLELQEALRINPDYTVAQRNLRAM